MLERAIVRAIAAGAGLPERRAWRWWRGEWAGGLYLSHGANRALRPLGYELVDAHYYITPRPRSVRRVASTAGGYICIRLGDRLR